MTDWYSYDHEPEIPIDLKCPICFEPFQMPLCDIICGHTFCYRCLEQWINRKQTCPICRQSFTEFVPLSDKKRLRALDALFVQCISCKTGSIERGKFHDHIRYFCSQPILVDSKEHQDCAKLNSLLKDLKGFRNCYPGEYQHLNQANFYPVPLWLIIISSSHLLLYLLILTPIAFIIYFMDVLVCPILRRAFWLLRFIRRRL